MDESRLHNYELETLDIHPVDPESRRIMPPSISLSLISAKQLGMRLPQDQYWAFSPLKRGPGGKVDRIIAFRDVRMGWKHGSNDGDVDMNEKQLAHVWNWGGNSGTHTPASVAEQFKREHGILLVDISMVDELHHCLFSDRLDSMVPQAEKSLLFRSLTQKCKEFVNAIIVHLDELGIFETGRPVAHCFSDLIDCISFLRKSVRERKRKNAKPASDLFLTSRISFWQGKLCTDNWSSNDWDDYKSYLLVELNDIYHSVRNIILLDPINRFAPYFTHGPHKSNKDLRQLPLVRRSHPHNLRRDILNSTGLKPGEINPRKSLDFPGALSDINARTLYNGPFRLALTDDPAHHLRFDESGTRDQPTILVLDSHTLCTLALLDLTGFMEIIGLPTFLAELLESHRLLFGAPNSESIARSLQDMNPQTRCIKEIDLNLVRDYCKNWSEHSLHITDFPIYGSRLQHIYQRMVDWRALVIRDVRFRPYRDPLSYYAFWFAVIIGLIGLLSLGLNAAQVVGNYRSNQSQP